MIVTTAGYPLALGLLWSLVPKAGFADELKRQVQATGKRHAVHSQRAAEAGSETVLFGMADSDMSGSVAAAGLLCGEFDDVLYVTAVDDGKFWVCVISDGDVFQDVVVADHKELLKSISQIVNDLKMMARSVTVSAPEELIEDLLEAAQLAAGDELIELHDTEWRDLKAIASSAEAVSRKAQWKIKAVRSGVSKNALMAVVLALLLVAYFYDDIFSEAPVELPPIEVPSLPVLVHEPVKESQESINARALEAAMVEEKQLFADRMNSHDAKVVIAGVIDRLAELPLAIRNWSLVSVKFDVTKELRSDAKYVSKRQAYLRDITDAFPGAALDISADAKSVVVSHAVAQASAGASFTADDIAGHGSLTAFIDKVKASDVAVGIAEYSWPVREHAIAELKGPDPMARVFTPAARTVSLSGVGLPRLALLAKNLGDEENFVVESVEYSIDGDSSWKLKGVYYE